MARPVRIPTPSAPRHSGRALGPNYMSDAFLTLCSEVYRDTKFLHLLKDHFPHYQRVLDYIVAHPEERQEMATALSGSLNGKPGSAPASIYLLQFLMKRLKWPEVRAAAEERFNDGGNHFHDVDLKELLDIYGAA